jgi:hypothetical protein
MTRRLQTQSRPSGSSSSRSAVLSDGRQGDRSCSCGNTCPDCRAQAAGSSHCPTLGPELIPSYGAMTCSRPPANAAGIRIAWGDGVAVRT